MACESWPRSLNASDWRLAMLPTQAKSWTCWKIQRWRKVQSSAQMQNSVVNWLSFRQICVLSFVSLVFKISLLSSGTFVGELERFRGWAGTFGGWAGTLWGVSGKFSGLLRQERMYKHQRFPEWSWRSFRRNWRRTSGEVWKEIFELVLLGKIVRSHFSHQNSTANFSPSNFTLRGSGLWRALRVVFLLTGPGNPPGRKSPKNGK